MKVRQEILKENRNVSQLDDETEKGQRKESSESQASGKSVQPGGRKHSRKEWGRGG